MDFPMDHTVVKEEWMDDEGEQAVNHQNSTDPTIVKCGEIFHRGTTSSFTFICASCSNGFESLDDFGQHIQYHIDDDKIRTTRPFQQEAPDDPLFSPQHAPSPDEASDTELPIQPEEIQIKQEKDESMKKSKRKPIRTLVPDQDVVLGKNHDPIPVDNNKFECPKCGRRYKHRQSLQAHMKREHAEKLPCRLCNGTYWNLNALRLHEKVEHHLYDEPGQLTASAKPAEFSSESQESHPVDAIEYDGKQECPRCEETFDRRKSLLIHVRCKHGIAALIEHFTKTDEMKYPCKYCNKAFLQADQLESHEKKHHWMELLNDDTNEAIIGEATFSCIFCNKSYPYLRELRLHVKDDHGFSFISADELTCRYCVKTFPTTDERNRHIEDDHVGPDKFQCSHCPKLFKSATNLAQHIFTHTGDRPFKCDECGEGFANQSNLIVHVRGHRRIKNHVCSFCPKTFVTSTEKKRHEQVHTGVRPYQCEQCGAQYPCLAKLNEHSYKHRNIKKFKCDICDKSFFTKKTLTDHYVVHSTERPFSCEICGQSFPRKRALIVHEKLHSNDKKYVCNVCGKAFAQPAGLYCHKKTHSNIE